MVYKKVWLDPKLAYVWVRNGQDLVTLVCVYVLIQGYYWIGHGIFKITLKTASHPM